MPEPVIDELRPTITLPNLVIECPNCGGADECQLCDDNGTITLLELLGPDADSAMVIDDDESSWTKTGILQAVRQAMRMTTENGIIRPGTKVPR